MTNGPAGGASSLFEALYDDEDAVVRALRAGASAESSDEDGATALYLASVQDLPGAVRMLLAAGADPNRASGPGRSGSAPWARRASATRAWPSPAAQRSAVKPNSSLRSGSAPADRSAPTTAA